MVEELHSEFYLILINLKQNSHIWLGSTVMDSRIPDYSRLEESSYSKL